ncbi:winged helix-turn-helix domain-containing protein [Chryseolinea soli]|uniref:Winged helix family transcriptional regulator n=1 Tax=Chryseolinea soli TaxID=2321403 RepID=A0A385SYD2_9BACT|nr:winged helix-turn-helix domain-containing protein [Chryseolinea soli]AYB33728.1 winged helix family transcriptional regulator [Chryseolinea soli]
MRLNSHFSGFFTHGLVVRSGMAIVMLAIFFIASSFTTPPDHDLRAKHVNLLIREIGHRLLLQAGDLTSRVLPVTETKEGTFLLQFENEFVFSHDSLMAMSLDLLPKTQFPSGYTVTVHDCLTAGIVYGFQFNNTTPDLLPCRGRRQPQGCYTIEFAFPDFYENIEQEKADVDPLDLKSGKVDPQDASPKREEIKPTNFGIDQTPEESVKAAPQEANSKPEEIKPTTLDHDIGQMPEESESVKVDPQEANQNFEEVNTTNFDYPFINLVYGGMVVVLVVILLMGRSGKILTPMPVQAQDHTIRKESVPELAALGKFLFDVKGQRLLLGSEVISLTDKECKILELFNKCFGELIPRETLMQEVWINEGVITGRSLDMFVSKLRKKLSSDPELRITNVHGKGYKLEMSGVQVV